MPPPSTVPRKRKSIPRSSESSGSSNEEQDEEYQPEAVSSTSRPARKRPTTTASQSHAPAKGKAMSREQLRKANHSQIERRRREKINTALGELRSMVPGLNEDGGKAGEFKLEVLERTVQHMRFLMGRIEELERDAEGDRSELKPRKKRKSVKAPEIDSDATEDMPYAQVPMKEDAAARYSATPPSPSLSPPNAPPSYTSNSNETNSTSHPHSLASLLAPAPSPRPAQQPVSRPAPPPQATNPTLYLPFPTPSPTSPFLYASTTASSSGASAPLEPSPFLAPMQHLGLFSGQINFSPNFSTTAARKPSPPDMDLPPAAKDKMGEEEAANLLLAFSSPDIMRPSHVEVEMGIGRSRRGTLENDGFVLDTATASGDSQRARAVYNGSGQRVVGKTASDILRM
ncbi:hypothetical protein P7C73_g2211, partial [Tremellales sp. Uapishka_1]